MSRRHENRGEILPQECGAASPFWVGFGSRLWQFGEEARRALGSMQLKTSAFCDGGVIPTRYTCEGMNCSPPLAWEQPPQATRSLALIVDDPDAPSGTWVHWVIYDLPSTATQLLEDVAKTQYLPGGAKQGLNDFRRLGYGGPCPPPGGPHRYFFRLYALDRLLDLKPGLTRKELDRAMNGHILGQSQLLGTYHR